MIHKLRFPQPPLSQFVENLWLVHGFVADYTREKILPDGAIELIFDLDPEPKSIFEDEVSTRVRTVKKAWISGERTRYIVIGAARNQSMVGVRFRPGGAYPFFRFPISELTESVTELDLIWGRLVDEIRDELSGIESPDARLLRLELLLMRQVQRSLEPNRLIAFAVQQLQHSPQFLAIRDLASMVGISQKHLISQFERVVGLRPKSFARVCKFQSVINLIEKQDQIEWSAIASDCGYYDQAHFIKEFQAFSGLNPSDYVNQRGDYVNYIPIA
ncbi:MAG: helix-turn-helix domain-containing protein [Pyrinomonadaceae bacterium]|nr:helix-turn-helix domain-containing protein [Pyrinomonadaceae bacterium]